MKEVFVPRESINDDTVIVHKILVASGAVVAAGAAIVEVETSKTSIEMTAPYGGRVAHDLTVGDEISVGALLFSVSGGDEPAAERFRSRYEASRIATESDITGSASLDRATAPALLSRAAAAAAGRNLDLRRFAGRWVTTDDLTGHAGIASTREDSADEQAERDAAEGDACSDVSRSRLTVKVGYREVAQSKRKSAEVANLTGGMHAATTSTIGIRIGLPGQRVVPPPAMFHSGIADLIVFEGARLLRQYPELNAFHIDARSNGYFEEVNFGLSFDNGKNLKVVALKSADRKALDEIQNEFMDLLGRYLGGDSIPPDLLETSTVTLSDLSGTRACYMLPLLNGRQSMNLGVVKRSQGDFELFASFDHRLSEGLRVALFLEELHDRVISHYLDESGNAHIRCHECGRSMSDETRRGAHGFVRVVLATGADANVCRDCFENCRP